MLMQVNLDLQICFEPTPQFILLFTNCWQQFACPFCWPYPTATTQINTHLLVCSRANLAKWHCLQ